MSRTLPSDRSRAAGQPAVPVRTAPYQGLRPFAERDAAYFFGRSTEAAIVAANLRSTRLTILYGPSGVGKSSRSARIPTRVVVSAPSVERTAASGCTQSGSSASPW